MGQVTDRDVRMLTWIGRHRAVMARHVEQRFDVIRRTVYQRLAVLREHGLVDYQRGPVGAAGVYLITSEGQELVGVEGIRAPQMSVARWLHDLGLVDLTLHFEARGIPVVTEREMHMAEASGANGHYTIRRMRSGCRSNGSRPHYPDLWLEPADGRRVAVELELTAKSTTRLRELLGGYRPAGHVTAVAYYVWGGRVRRRIERVALEVGLRDEEPAEPQPQLRIRDWQPPYEQ